MTNKQKPFDCVEMKHKGAELVQARLAGMTREEHNIIKIKRHVLAVISLEL